MNTRLSIASLLAGAMVLQAQTVTIKEATGWIESAQVKWQTSGNPDSYNVYVSGQGLSNQQLDAKLIRNYGGYWRADAIGLKAGSYTLTVAPVTSGKEGAKVTSSALTVTAHNRAGFAFSGGRIPGAYNLDGTPMSGAVIVYVSDKSKDTVSLNVTGASTNPCVGLQNILYGFKKGKDTRPLIVRILGQVKDPAVMDGGDIVIENANLAAGHITLEGVGEDAVADGWGIRLKSASNIEVRNLGVMNVNSTAGDDIGLQQDNDHVWIHNIDFFYGDAGSDADQVKGDGAMDVKKSTYVTISYNHFWDNGKASLLGLSENTTTGLYIDYHHNWFDHSDSRHPRVRFYSAHVYNNYYDGVAKYGAGSTMGSSIFMEGNYFRNCKHPMMTSMQGTDVWNETTKANDYKNMGTFSSEDGGTIKAWNNFMEGQSRFVPYGSKDFVNSTVDFDAYVATSRTEKVPATVKSAYGANVYNNFDTDNSVMYAYTADSPADAKTKVESYAGRMGGGDLKWTFKNAADDSSALVNAPLKAALVAFKGALTYIQGEGKFQPSSVQKLSATGSDPIRVDLRSHKLSVADGLTMRSAQILGLDGTHVMEWNATTEANFAGLRSGIYLARVHTDRGTFQKLICNKN
ncbi:MAG: pectate lyase [Fibrobacteres bacterium]|nr:pectate lyase [Fibrobacterota bacterium]